MQISQIERAGGPGSWDGLGLPHWDPGLRTSQGEALEGETASGGLNWPCAGIQLGAGQGVRGHSIACCCLLQQCQLLWQLKSEILLLSLTTVMDLLMKTVPVLIPQGWFYSFCW